MNRTIPLALASLCLALTGVPPAPAADEYGGLSCGFDGVSAREDPAGYVSGVVHGGPWYERRPAVEVTLTCRIEAEYGGARVELYSVAVTTVGGAPATVPPTPASFRSGSPGTNLWVCTEVTVYDPGAVPPLHYRHVDADGDPSNGAQCAKTEPDSGDFVYVYVAPPHPSGSGDLCWFADHNVGGTDLPPPLRDVPPPPEEVCLPVGPPI